MIRRTILLSLTLATLGAPRLCHAQQSPSIDSVMAVARADMIADKTTILTAVMNFDDKEASVFWPIYREYEHERSGLDDRRVAVIKLYMQKYPSIPDTDARAMANEMFDCDSRLAELKKKYFRKFNKVLPALTVTKFFQLERRIDLTVDMQVESSLPPLTQTQDRSESK